MTTREELSDIINEAFGWDPPETIHAQLSDLLDKLEKWAK